MLVGSFRNCGHGKQPGLLQRALSAGLVFHATWRPAAPTAFSRRRSAALDGDSAFVRPTSHARRHMNPATPTPIAAARLRSSVSVLQSQATVPSCRPRLPCFNPAMFKLHGVQRPQQRPAGDVVPHWTVWRSLAGTFKRPAKFLRSKVLSVTSRVAYRGRNPGIDRRICCRRR